MMQLLLRSAGGEQAWSIGGASYFPDHPAQDRKLLVAIKCRFGDFKEEHIALLDTGAPWPICKKEIADSLGLTEENSLKNESLITYLGPVNGFLNRCDIALVSEFGEELCIDATLFVSKDWTGPNVIGWKGCLERIRFALDPHSNIIFYGTY